MILVDTSVWVSSMHAAGAATTKVMREILRRDHALGHDFIHGELMLGKGGRTRGEVVELYTKLRRLETLPHEAVVSFIKKHKLENRGVGLVDAHLLASAASAGAKVWTVDKTMKLAADDLELVFDPAKDAS